LCELQGAKKHLPALIVVRGQTKTDPASMSKVTVLKVDTSCAKCKRKVLQAVSGLQGTIPAASTMRHEFRQCNGVG